MSDEPERAVTQAEAEQARLDPGRSEPRTDPPTRAPEGGVSGFTDITSPHGIAERGETGGSEGSGDGVVSTTTTGPRRRRRGSRGRGRGRSGAARASSDGEPAGDGERVDDGAAVDSSPDGAASLDTGVDDGSEHGANGGASGQGTTAKPRRRRGSRGRGRSRSGAAASTKQAGNETEDSDEPAAAGDDVGSDETDGGSSPTRARSRSRSRSRSRPAGSSAEDAPAAPTRARSASRRTTSGTGAGGEKDGDGEAADGADTEAAGAEAADGAEAPLSASAKRRRRRRRAASAGSAAAPAGTSVRTTQAKGKTRETKASKAEASAATAVSKAEAPAESKPTAKQATATRTARRRGRAGAAKESEEGGSTRTRRSRATLRRREPMPTVPRGTGKIMLITEHGERDQIAVVEDRQLVEHYITRVGAKSMVGNIYLGRVQNVLPGMEAAFIDIGKGRNAVLYAGEVSYDEDIGGRQQRIEQVLKPGQAALVQVTKDPIGGKGPRLTQEISLPGRYVVMVPNSEVFGISRRLPDNERRRLRASIRKVRPEQHGVIVRTAAEGATEEDLAADLKRLAAEWESISKKAKKAKAPHLLYEEPELTVRVVRDLFNDEEFKEIVTDSEPVAALVRNYLASVAPELVDKVHLHEGKLPLFEQYHLIEQIHKALERKVWLPSGGYIVIDKTEAMTVVDVNTGKHVGKANLEETVTKTNLEAAEEIARQLRLRDIGGMILIDFIDMLLEQNKREVIDTLKNAMAKDKTRSQVFDISPLGILEVTRKRVSAGLLESFSETCPTCGGRGILITHEI